TVLIHEKLVDDDGRGPRANALVNLDMLLWTEGQQFTFADLRELLTRAGFPVPGVKRTATAGYWSAVTARKA
ncbi:methyltransferase, partial [bacterium]|nr:methyltransferase [bacterium]